MGSNETADSVIEHHFGSIILSMLLINITDWSVLINKNSSISTKENKDGFSCIKGCKEALKSGTRSSKTIMYKVRQM
jgi:hypothetical protein